MVARFRDGLNFASKFTLKRAWNLVKVLSSFYYSKWTRKPVQWGMPISVSMEPTTACNLRCPECPSGLRQFSRNTGMIRTEDHQRWIDELSERTIYLLFYFQGEPFIHPNFLDMVSYAASKGIYTATSTNAHFLHENLAERTIASGLDRLIVSVDGTTQEVYEQYRRNGSLEKALNGIRNLIRKKRENRSGTPHVILQFLVVKPNEHQIEEVARLGKELGVDEVRYKTAQINDPYDSNDLIPSRAKYARYKKGEDGKYRIKYTLKDHCWKLWHSSVITWDGTVVPCCFDKDAEHRLGDLQEKSFEAIWKGPAYTAFRQSVLGSRSSIDICRNCTEGCKVWA
ncbi:MAG: SPASM domain-containing protein [Flavobacteriales bacterium]